VLIWASFPDLRARWFPKGKRCVGCIAKKEIEKSDESRNKTSHNNAAAARASSKLASVSRLFFAAACASWRKAPRDSA
jgi:hypothetical protein